MPAANFRTFHRFALLIASALAATVAFADPPARQNYHGSPHEDARERDRHDDRHDRAEYRDRHFDDHHRTLVRDYYGERFRAGHCPPGLRKKHNSCLPPGHAKQWQVGRQLPPHVIFHNLPPHLRREFGEPPAGYRYVRVGADILMITVGIGMVVDAIEDIGRID